MPTIYEIARDHQKALRSLDRRTATDLVAAYGVAFEHIGIELTELTKQIEAARRAGQIVTRSWLLRQARLEDILASIAREIGGFASHAEVATLNGQRQAVETALSFSQDSVAEGARRRLSAGIETSFRRFPVEAFQQQVSLLTTASPVHKLFATFGPLAAEQAEHTLLSAVAEGLNPRTTARLLKDDLGISLTRAETIARTEQLRGARSAAQSVYEANSDIVKGWIWTAALDMRTCPVCLAMHGTRHKLSEEMGSHPNCRCIQRPEIDGIADTAQTGEVFFAKLQPEQQQQVLGPMKWAAYRDGRITLADLVERTHSKAWGPGLKEASLDMALAAHPRIAA